jgi:hypothetical protein
MEPSSTGKGEGQVIGVRQLLGCGKSFVVPLKGLVRITKMPQSPGCMGKANHSGVLLIEKGMGAVLLGAVEGNPLLEVLSGWDKLSQEVQSNSQRGAIPAYDYFRRRL